MAGFTDNTEKKCRHEEITCEYNWIESLLATLIFNHRY